MEKDKQRALDHLGVVKRDKIHLQKELSYRLDVIDRDLDFYRIERNELIADRWFHDHHLGLPVGKRPQAMKEEKESEIALQE